MIPTRQRETGRAARGRRETRPRGREESGPASAGGGEKWRRKKGN
ncbi:hypothetical protein CCACVL1_04020 [Corchorus capsularis]|uniref:Uncharacterized protein n=1 Tax=Corchorus capsularis TaxID=210143 RepID=A0A1R3JVG8_COCAP|nr:hypothetical protein CCACVL1_04020 [Corchorus capsularis]